MTVAPTPVDTAPCAEASAADPTCTPRRASMSPAVASIRSSYALVPTKNPRITSLLSTRARPDRSARWSLAALAMVASACLAWTLWLMLLTYAPNETVNRMMGTTTLDEGSFWRFIDPPPAELAVGLGGLGAVVLAYVYIIARVTCFRHRRFIGWRSVAKRKQSVGRYISRFRHRMDKIAVESHETRTSGEKHTRAGSVVTRQLASVMRDLVTEESTTRKDINVMIKLVDFGVQFILLIDSMETGLPVVLIVLFTTIIVLNAISTTLMILVTLPHPGLSELLLDTFFDVLIAFVFPGTVLRYCITKFSFDMKLFDITLAVFPPGWFERGASVNTNPVQRSVVRTALDSLRVFTLLSAFARVGTHFTICLRFYRLASRLQNPAGQCAVIYPKKSPVAAVFALIAIAAVVVVTECIQTSTIACQPHPECIQHAWRWIQLRDDDLSQCPCRSLVDVNLFVGSYDDWVSPPNMTEKLGQLSAQGTLRMITLVNRQLAVFPEELRRCSGLRHVTLMYTNTIALPPWMKDFKQLEYLHIEGKFNVAMLEDMPSDLFDDMQSLTFIHLGANNVTRLPSFDGLTNLKSLALAMFINMKELPSFQGLRSLERLVMAILPAVESIPDMAPLKKLQSFVTSDRGMFCCNGFASPCNLTHSMCQRHLVWGSPPATCLPSNSDKLATAATRAMFASNPYTVCAGQAHKPGDLEIAPSKELIEQCNGTMYKQCHLPNRTEAMCYNPRMMAVMCDGNPFPIEMRRRQIAARLGGACDPKLEAWLGCS